MFIVIDPLHGITVATVFAIVGSTVGVFVGLFVGHLVETVVMSKDDNYDVKINDAGKKDCNVINV